jgi:hypothetical protein
MIRGLIYGRIDSPLAAKTSTLPRVTFLQSFLMALGNVRQRRHFIP